MDPEIAKLQGLSDADFVKEVRLAGLHRPSWMALPATQQAILLEIRLRVLLSCASAPAVPFP